MKTILFSDFIEKHFVFPSYWINTQVAWSPDYRVTTMFGITCFADTIPISVYRVLVIRDLHVFPKKTKVGIPHEATKIWSMAERSQCDHRIMQVRAIPAEMIDTTRTPRSVPGCH